MYMYMHTCAFNVDMYFSYYYDGYSIIGASLCDCIALIKFRFQKGGEREEIITIRDREREGGGRGSKFK